MADEQEKIMSKEKMNEALNEDVLLQSILGKLYEIVTTGEAESQGKKSFFAWYTPGEPISESAFDFMDDSGLMGKTPDSDTLKSYLDAAGVTLTADENGQKILTDLIKIKTAEDTKRRLRHAADFAWLVDVIPDTSGLTKTINEAGKEQQTHMEATVENGSLSQVYRHTLETCSVKMTEPSKETEEALEFYRSQIFKKVPKPVPQTDEGTANEASKTDSSAEGTNSESQSAIADLLKSIAGGDDSTKDSGNYKFVANDMNNYQDWVRNCLEKQDKYLRAKREYAMLRAKAVAGQNSEDLLGFAFGVGAASEAEVEKALQEWELAGKDKYEKIASLVSLLEKEDMATLLQSYRHVMETDRIMDADSSSDVYYTTLAPASFITSGGWQNFSFRTKDLTKTRHTDFDNFNSALNIKAKAGFGLIGAKAEAHYSDENEDREIDMSQYFTDVEISFDICQVRIVRPWFNDAFLSSRFWKFRNDDGSDSAEMLSDGQIPPQGLLPAYPVMAIFIRNLKFTFLHTEDFNNFTSNYNRVTQDYKASVRILCFKGSGGYNSDKSGSESDCTITSSSESKSITVNGMQLIGYKCKLLDKSPNPDPLVLKWT